MTDSTRSAKEATRPEPPPDTASRLVQVASDLWDGELPLRIRAWDGSEAGPAGAPVLVIRSRRALRRLVWQPNELGLADAFVSGDLDLEGDVSEALSLARSSLTRDNPARVRHRWVTLARAAALAARLGAIGPRPPTPAPRAQVTGTRNSRSRDRAVIRHHYDQSNELYQLLLDDTMAYSCGYWVDDRPGYGLADAQRDKLELICRKLELTDGDHLLDLGCGWGSLTLYAAERHQTRVTAVTLSHEQSRFLTRRVQQRGLDELVDVHLSDYRDLASHQRFDAVAAVEIGEHVGADGYPAFAAALHRRLRPGGRLLVQQMSRGPDSPGGGPFIESYIAPDMHMRPLGETVTLLEGTGLEVRSVESLREHYARTAAAWRDTLTGRWDDVVELVGPAAARVWLLYLTGGAHAFEQGRMGVDQIVAVRPTATGTSAMPATPAGWYQLQETR